MRLTIEHRTRYAYEPPALNLHLRLKLFAPATAGQSIREWEVSIGGEPARPMLTDAFGDAEAVIALRKATEEVEVVARGVVETADTAGVLGRIGLARPEVSLRTTELTRADEAIEALAREAADEEGLLAQMHRLSALTAEALDYRPGATDADTTAAQALAIGSGVCQDFTHVLIAAARALGVPARYVVGYLHDPEAPLSETHAWAEAHIAGLGWVGFDPVHQVCPAETYVRLASGFDAADAAPIRGTLSAGHEEEMEVAVRVSAGQMQQQQQQG
ncbi:transglutaminase family protein [Limibaculum sp. M0105]|uniref:Transglutaminase family protein n=1 Tax=Thermohalobaculum xanthum TaxID=2753746 RepID=A0A8J7M7G1_9RHOB|nr:transglutaminase family protein [Thermohalobaculum xanthum]MBK0399105.1 transglutaminase family protein [Thermohalobaculum xanthum]